MPLYCLWSQGGKNTQEELPRFPEIEKAIIETLKSRKGISDYTTLQNLMPRVTFEEFFISTHHLIEDEIIKDGSLKEIKALVQWGENMLVEGTGLSRLIILIKK